MKISMIGTGYVGLTTGTCFSDSGNDVFCVDVDREKIKKLSQGEPTFYEPGLKELITRNIEENRLTFTTDLPLAVRASDIVFLTVGTPPMEDGSCDLSALKDSALMVAKVCNGPKVLVIKSTVPVGTNHAVRELVRDASKHDIEVVSNPEFLREGSAVDDFMRPDRVVIGTWGPEAEKVMRGLYEPFVRTGSPVMVMDPSSAELAKYVSNAILACRISMINEMARIAEAVGADIERVREAAGKDKRIGSSYLFPGIGYGGSCFPKDVSALVHLAKRAGIQPSLLEAVEEVNQDARKHFLERILSHFSGEVRGKTIAVWGLSFKPKTDDVRESPAVFLVQNLLDKGAKIRVYDPEAMDRVKQSLGGKIEYADKPYDTLKDADVLIVATEWNEFRQPDFKRMASLMKTPVIFDGRNIYNPQTVLAAGFTYHAVGRTFQKSS